MERPRILLDENLLYCCGYSREIGEALKDELARAGVDRDAIVYVGQGSVPAEIEPLLQAARFHKESDEYGAQVERAAIFCNQQVEKRKRELAREGKRLTNPTAVFKECFETSLQNIRTVGPTISDQEGYSRGVAPIERGRVSYRVPPRGAADPDIRAWATTNSIVIVSEDRGSDLESFEKGARIAVQRPACPCSDRDARKKYVEALARRICERLGEIGMILRGFVP